MIKQFKIFEPFRKELIHGVTTKAWNEKFNVEPISANQVHGDSILVLNERPNKKPDCDAFITQKKNLPVMVKVADCQGVLMYDPVTKAIASVHSGWRGSTRNILGKTILKMQRELGIDPRNLRIAISPSLRQCCARFSDPLNELPAFCHKYVDGNKVDLIKLSIDQCMLEGVPREQIEVAEDCTKCNSGYYSHRNQDKSRMAVFIGLK